MNQIDLSISIPEAFHGLPEVVYKKILSEMFDGSFAIPSSEFIKDIPELLKVKPGICTCFRLALYIINFLSSEDPSNFHYQASRDILKKEGGESLASEENARDFLARELVRECKNFAYQIIPSEYLQENVREKLIYFPIKCDIDVKHLAYAINGKLWIDSAFIIFLEKIGAFGKTVANDISKASTKWYKQYLIDKKSSGLFRLWVDKEITPYYCRYLKILAEVLWKDRIREHLDKRKKLHPALPNAVWVQTIKPTLSKNMRLERDENQITVSEVTGKVAISVKIACMDKRSLDLVTRGIGALGSLTGHRILRWELKSGCKNLIDDVSDQRVLITEGGYEGIANLSRCGKNKSTVTEVKSILYSQANANFHLPNGDKATSLIILQEIEHNRNGEPSKIKIILGDLLLPHFLFSLPKNEQRLLIPITDLPPLVGSPNTHASQAMLQILVLEEISKQSDRLVQKGSAYIPKEKWEEMAREAKLLPSHLPNVIEGWSSKEINGTAFLQKDNDEFTLSNTYLDALQFIEDQGRRRITGEKSGKESARKAAKKKAKILKPTDF